MAIELHAQNCNSRDEESLGVALQQLDQLNSYVRRLLLLGKGSAERDRPQSVSECMQDLQKSLHPIAVHHHVDLRWNISPDLQDYQVQDGPSLSGAVSNLVLNAIEVARTVSVQANLGEDQSLTLNVADNGPGIPKELESGLFDAFTTSKPEGMGLGLPFVRRAVEHLHGNVGWCRHEGWTVFELTAKLCPDKRVS